MCAFLNDSQLIGCQEMYCLRLHEFVCIQLTMVILKSFSNAEPNANRDSKKRLLSEIL